MEVEHFKKSEDEFFRLKGRLAAGRITFEQFENALKALMVQDTQGRWWMLGRDSGQWHVQEGGKWVPATPPLTPSAPPPLSPSAPPPTSLPERAARAPETALAPESYPRPAPVAPTPAPAPQKSGGCCTCRTIGCGCLVLLVLVAAAVGGLYLAFTQGYITQAQLLNLVGLGPANIEVANFRDDRINVNITQVGSSQDSTPVSRGGRLNAFDVKSFRISNAGRYRVEFSTVNPSANLGACTLTLRGGDEYQFVLLPDRIALNRSLNPSQVGKDFVISTSSLCR